MVIQSFADVAKAIGTYWLALIVLFEASPYSATLAPLTVIVVNHCKQSLVGLRSRPESSPIIPRMTEGAATDLPAQGGRLAGAPPANLRPVSESARVRG